jgi:hypothetical protein
MKIFKSDVGQEKHVIIKKFEILNMTFIIPQIIFSSFIYRRYSIFGILESSKGSSRNLEEE